VTYQVVAEETPTYRIFGREVCGGKKRFYVIVGHGENEMICTKFTRDPALAEQWCRELTRAAQVEADRKRAVRGGA
jgi:hypothetical protein